MQNSEFNPRNIGEFDKAKLLKSAKGIFATATHETDTTIDFTLTDDVLMAGGNCLLAKGAEWGDYISLQVVHPVNGVLLEFLTSWPVNPQVYSQELPLANYPAKIPGGLKIRAIYHSVGTSNVSLAIGYNFEKVMA